MPHLFGRETALLPRVSVIVMYGKPPCLSSTQQVHTEKICSAYLPGLRNEPNGMWDMGILSKLVAHYKYLGMEFFVQIFGDGMVLAVRIPGPSGADPSGLLRM